jgi:hypothetical protein
MTSNFVEHHLELTLVVETIFSIGFVSEREYGGQGSEDCYK